MISIKPQLDQQKQFFFPEMFNIHIMVAVSSYGRFESVA